MKTLALFISLFGICLAQFAPRSILDSNLTRKVFQITTADLDNDGLKELLITQRKNSGEYLIGFYSNQGNGNFSNLQIVDSNSLSFTFKSIACDDINGDGPKDIVACGYVSMLSGKLFLYTNTGTGFSKSLIDSSLAIPVKVIIKDINKDNGKDILLSLDTSLVVYSNNNGNFIKTALPNPGTENYDIAMTDIDNDGYQDLVVGGVQIFIYKNNNGTLEPDTTRNAAIPKDPALKMKVHLNDFNNDGAPDLIVYTSTQELRIYPNDGTGNFTSYQVFAGNVAQLFSMASADFDNDGDNDLLAALPQQGKIVWYPNDGAGNFASPITIFQGTSPYTQQVHTADLNNDNLPDVIWANELSVHLNNSQTVNLTENYQDNPVKIFLAPTTKLLHIITSERVTVSLYNLLGETVMSPQKLPEGMNTLNLSSYKPGIYLLTVTGQKVSERHKLLITSDE